VPRAAHLCTAGQGGCVESVAPGQGVGPAERPREKWPKWLAVCFPLVPSEPAVPRPDLIAGMLVLRRIAAATVFILVAATWVLGPTPPPVAAFVATAAVVLAYNEAGRWLLERVAPARVRLVVNGQIVCDTLALVTLLHLGGGVANLGIAFACVPFFVAGAILTLPEVFAHVLLMTVVFAAVAWAEAQGVLVHRPDGFFTATAYQRPEFASLRLLNVTVLNVLVAYLSHYVAKLLRAKELEARVLAAERGRLLAENEREAERVRALLASNQQVYGRVRALLDVAQHVSGSHSVDELLCAVCDTTAAMVRVPRVEIFLWDDARKVLRLAAARGLARGSLADQERQYADDVPIVAQLRAGAVVDFGAAPAPTFVSSRLDAPFRRGFAAPMACREAFVGALFVGYDDENGDELKELVQGIARQAAVALVNVRALQLQQEDADVSRGLLRLSQALSACLNEEELWSLLVRGTSEALGVPYVVGSCFDEQSARFRIAATAGLADAVADSLTDASFRLDEVPVLQELIARREVTLVEEPPPTPLVPVVPRGPLLAIPLFHSGWIAGFVVAAGFGGRRPTARQLRLAEGLAHHASIALENARLVADLEAANRVKTDFVSTMSHELRTPLNVIIGFTEMLRDGAAGPVTQSQLELIDRVDARGRELLELIEATLHAGRLEAGRDSVDVAPIGLPELLAVLEASASGLPRPAGVEVEWEAPTALGVPLYTDRAKLALVVRNLVGNALKFTHDGRVVVRLRPQGDALLVEVCDTGIGIDAAHLPVIFDMFRQVDGSMTRRHGGVGLGLYIVKQCVVQLGGSVEVESEPGRGSVFRVVLPGAIRSESAPSPTRTQAA
jgi:signal transduction histidine kinase